MYGLVETCAASGVAHANLTSLRMHSLVSCRSPLVSAVEGDGLPTSKWLRDYYRLNLQQICWPGVEGSVFLFSRLLVVLASAVAKAVVGGVFVVVIVDVVAAAANEPSRKAF